MTEPHWDLVLTPPAVRAIRDRLAEPVAAAVIEFLTGPLVENPQRAGRELRRELQGVWSARRGTYRVLYRIDERRGTPRRIIAVNGTEVIVERIEHRDQAYRTR